MRRPIPALIHTALAALTVAVATSGVQAESNDEKKKACAAPDMQTRGIGNKFCFAIRAYAAQTAGPSPTLGTVSEKVTSSFDLPLIRNLGKAFYWQKVIDAGEMANASESKWWRGGGSNSRPSHCERDALPAELPPHESQILREAAMDPGRCSRPPKARYRA